MDVLKLLCESSFDRYQWKKSNLAHQWQSESEDARSWTARAYKRTIDKPEQLPLKDNLAIYTKYVEKISACKTEIKKLPNLLAKLQSSQKILKILALGSSIICVGSLVFLFQNARAFIKNTKDVGNSGEFRFVAGLCLGSGILFGSGVLACHAFPISSDAYLTEIQKEIDLFQEIVKKTLVDLGGEEETDYKQKVATNAQEIAVAINTWLGIKE